MNVGTRRTLRVPADVGRVAELRALVREAAFEAGAPAACVDDVVQAVDEMATNVIVHGYAGRPGWVELSIEVGERRIVMTLEDEAPLFDPRPHPDPDLRVPPQRRTPGGMGIHLLRQSVDAIDHRPRPGGGNILTMTRTFDPRPREG